MRILARNSFAWKMTLMAVLASGLGSTCLIGALLAYDTVAARVQLNRRLETLLTIVGQNSAASLFFRDPAAATEVLSALKAERSVDSACLYDRTGSLFAEYRRTEAIKHCFSQDGRQAEHWADGTTMGQTIEQQGLWPELFVSRPTPTRSVGGGSICCGSAAVCFCWRWQ
jgi:hypothetical protein